MDYGEMRKTEIEMYEYTERKLHDVLITHVKLYGSVFYRIDDVFSLSNEEMKRKIIEEALIKVLE